MLASELPFEILSLVGDFLLTCERFQCIFVCKGWKVPFQESFWKNTEVDTLEELESICTIVKYSTNNFPYGLIAQTLTINGQCTLSNMMQSNAFKTFQNLKHLAFRCISLDNFDIRNVTYNYPWQYLISVNLRIETSKLNVPTPILIKLLTNYPSLKEINISTHSSTKLLNFNLRNFNTLHKRSPQLEYIKGCFSLTDIHQNSLKTIPSTTPALHVTALDLDLLDWDHLWLYYFSYKYPNLHTLKWKTMCVSRKRIVKKYNAEKMVLLNSLQSVFPHLEMVDFYTEDRTAWSHTLFWKLLCRLNVPLKRIRYMIKFSGCGPSFLGIIIQRFFQSFSTTLEKISIIGDAYFKAKNIVRSEFPYCPRLTSIELTDCGISITLDNILDNCPALRQLKFSRGQLTNSPEAHKESNKHGLHIVELDEIVTSASVFNYMSFRCRDLQYMNLSRSQIGGSISAKTGSLCVDMSYTSFKLLQLSHVRFYSSENAMDKDTAINLTLLSHLTGLDMTAETEDLNKALEHSVENLAWYHLYCELGGLFDFTLEVRQLLEQEVCDVVEYFQRSRVKNMSQSSEADRSFDGQVSQDDWKEDLYRGYVELRCGHVAKYVVPSLWVSENSFWKRLFDSPVKI